MKTILVDAVDCFVSNKGEINQAMYKMLERYENPKIIVTNAPDDKLSVFKKLGQGAVPCIFITEKSIQN